MAVKELVKPGERLKMTYLDYRPAPQAPAGRVYQLDERGQYRPVPVGADGRYHSRALPGFWLQVEWLWADELPDSLFAFAEIANLPAEVVQALRGLQRG